MKYFKTKTATILLLVLVCVFKPKAERAISSETGSKRVLKRYTTKSNSKRELTTTQKQLQMVRHLLEREKVKGNIILISTILLSVVTILWYRKLWIRYRNRIIFLENQRAYVEKEAEEAFRQNKTFIENIREKSVLISDLKKAIDINQVTKKANQKDLHDYLYNGSLLIPKQWVKFKIEFEKLYPLVLLQVRELTPRITSAEERLICLIYLQLSNKQIGDALGISLDSVARSKRRLRVRIPVPTGDCLENFIFKLNTFIPIANFNQQLKMIEV